MGKKKIICVVLIMVIVISSTENIYAFVSGHSGSVSPGDVVNARGGINWTAYKVCFVDMEGENALTNDNIISYKDEDDDIEDKLRNNYSKKFPAILNYTYFIKPKIWKPNAYLAYYDFSVQDLLTVPEGIKENKLHQLTTSKRESNVFYEKLKIEVPSLEILMTKKEANRLWWLTILNGYSEANVECQKVWNHIFQSEDGIEKRIKDYIGDNDSDPLTKKLKYLDLLMTLLAVDENLKDTMIQYINRYVYGDSLENKPVLLSIESAVRVSSSEMFDKTYAYMSSTDYLMFMYGAVGKWSVYKNPKYPEQVTDHSTKSIVENSYKASYNSKKDLTRLTEIYQSSTKKNAFSHGLSGVIGGYFSTKNGVPNWRYWSGRTGVMHGLTYHGNQIGFILVGGRNNKPQVDPTLTISMNTTIGPDGDKRYEVPVEMESVGVEAYLDVSLGQTNDNLIKWKTLIADLDVTFDFTLNLTPSDKLSKLDQSAPDMCIKKTNMNRLELEDILSGTSSFRYQDKLSDVSIEEEETIIKDYTAQLIIDYTNNGITKQVVSNHVTESVEAHRGKIPEPKTGNYSSATKVFSQIKQGAPGHEQFEAMAGVPTTRHVYFSSGGAEYIVDIAVELHKRQQSTRNYKSFFSSVPSENNMPVIHNSWTKDKPAPKPTPRQKTDHMGTTTIEPISQETRPYLKYPPIAAKNGSWSTSSVSAPTPRKSTAWDGTTRSETTGVGSKTVVDKPAVSEKKDKDGNVIRPAEPEVNHMEYRQEWYGFSGENGTEYRWVQEGHDKTVGGYEETWSQTITYDYMEITDVAVYEITEALVDGMGTITGTDKIIGTVVQGQPSVFYNIDETNTAAGGRLVYSLETNQNDDVVWDEGPSDNAEENKTDSGRVIEEDIWKMRKETMTNVTVVSDFLILQTTKGDRSVMYFDQQSMDFKTEEPIELPESSLDDQWINNPNAAFGWQPDELDITGYTGDYEDVETAHAAYASSHVTTAHDAPETSVNRPARPTKPLRLLKNNIDIVDTLANREYITGHAKVFYQQVAPKKGNPTAYHPRYVGDFGMTGIELTSTYSSRHSKINDIVVHNPVSVQDAMIVSLPASRDQRTPSSLPKDMALNTSVMEYEKVLVEVTKPPVYNTIQVPNPKYKEKEVPNPDYQPAKDVEGQTISFSYTGNYKVFTVPTTGEYIVTAKGASGGGTPSHPNHGGYGSTVTSTFQWTAGQQFYVYVGGKGGNSPSDRIDQFNRRNYNGGYNGGGYGSGSRGPGGGGRSDIRTSTSSTSEIIVAGGGGGSASAQQGSAIKSNGNRVNGSNGPTGWSGKYEYDTGGGGGGYYGGQTVSGDDPSRGYAGTNYSAGSNTTTSTGSNNSHGSITIKQPAIHMPAVGEPTIWVPASDEPQFIDKQVLVSGGETVYEYQLVPIEVKPEPVQVGGVNYTPGNFINIDYGFTIYFPNRGDFYGNGRSGLGNTSFIRGKGYTDNMDTTEWTKSKEVTFPFAVIYEDDMYLPGEKITLDKAKENFSFYLPLAASEAMSAEVMFKAKANNCRYDDANSFTNRVRTGSKEAKHAAKQITYIDVVGRIGNLVMEDTEDFRFSNLFKQAVSGWFVENVVPKVNPEKQLNIMSDPIDIRGERVNAYNHYLNTYGAITSFNREPIRFPLSPSKNNIMALRNQPQRPGYLSYLDISTLGNYEKVQVIPYYYHLSLVDGTITPLDVYMNTESGYRPINIYDLVKTDWDTNAVYHYKYWVDWGMEKMRRCVELAEENKTQSVIDYTKQIDGDGVEYIKESPYGNTFAGIAQLVQLSERNRTYIGSSTTGGKDNNPGNRNLEQMYTKNAQRWHFKSGLPSSAIAVHHGKPISKGNMDSVSNNQSVIIMALDIKSAGTLYNLEYKHPSGNGTLDIAGLAFDLTSIPHNVITVYSAHKSSANDLSISGTH